MGAVHKLYDDQPDYKPASKMKIPFQSEISRFMADKKGWPDEFCVWYADKFWNHYQSQGWVLSNGNKMKDWKACFNNNWQEIKGDVLIKLNSHKKIEKLSEMDNNTALMYMDKILMSYKHGLKPDRETAIQMYDRLKAMGKMKLTKEAIEWVREKGGNNNDSCKMWALKYLLDNMKENNLTFQ